MGHAVRRVGNCPGHEGDRRAPRGLSLPHRIPRCTLGPGATIAAMVNTATPEDAMVQTRRGAARALAEMDERIARFAELQPDWDSYGAKVIAPVAIATARDVLRTIIQAAEPALGERVLAVWIAPLPNGGVVLEWRGATADLEVEVTASGVLQILLEARAAGQDETVERSGVRAEDVAALLDGVLAA